MGGELVRVGSERNKYARTLPSAIVWFRFPKDHPSITSAGRGITTKNATARITRTNTTEFFVRMYKN